MIAGVVLEDSLEKDSAAVFMGDDGIESLCFTENSELVEMIVEREPEIVAFNTAVELTDETEEHEEEVSDEGFVFTPASYERELVKRLEALKRDLFQEMGSEGPEIIRFEPNITADELAVHDEEAVESYGVDPSCVESSREFDALLGAITARFYQENDVRDLGIIVPGSKEVEEEEGNT